MVGNEIIRQHSPILSTLGNSILPTIFRNKTKLPVRLINTTNEWRLVKGPKTTSLRVKGDIVDVSNELDNED
ncbi:hypothetical protein TNCV_3577191 [Trichonephila clavipes]|uniref:Uncharacterized protein n=1 Tax=Trichonephila clavipes TaxID=2585209 RepID=A0A8X6V3K0_TRICX|nr:hypothetical protein TNCV_3577191 [Trichonephila clavipes]